MDADRQILEHLEPALAAGASDESAAMLAFLALERLRLDPAAVGAAVRRALLVQASGGDLRREVSFSDQAVATLAADLDDPARREELSEALAELRERADGLTGASAALDGLRADPDRAWLALAAAILADELTDDES